MSFFDIAAIPFAVLEGQRSGIPPASSMLALALNRLQPTASDIAHVFLRRRTLTSAIEFRISNYFTDLERTVSKRALLCGGIAPFRAEQIIDQVEGWLAAFGWNAAKFAVIESAVRLIKGIPPIPNEDAPPATVSFPGGRQSSGFWVAGSG